MIEVIDQTGNTVRLPERPDRIVSVVPSQTELLSDLGLDDILAGITKFCIHPDHIFRTRTRVGGTKSINIEKVRELKPDIIFANKEENLKEEIIQLREEFPVYTSDISNLEEALEMIAQISILTDTVEKGTSLINEIRANFHKLENKNTGLSDRSCLYLIWKGPWMAAGKGTFIDDMLQKCRLTNVIKEERYPEVTEESIQSLNPEVILLSSEPYPFKEKHIESLARLCPHSNIVLADGEMFSWYGSRMLIAGGYLASFRNKLL